MHRMYIFAELNTRAAEAAQADIAILTASTQTSFEVRHSMLSIRNVG